MPRTIVQEYGPIYGEPVNGTVQGRPNGSVYVPITNTIDLTLADDFRYFVYTDTTITLSDSAGSTASVSDERYMYAVAQSQDLASSIQFQLYSDAELTTLAAFRTIAAGTFNTKYRSLRNPIEGLTDGQTLYLRAQLMNNNVAVATSNVIEVTMVVLE